MKFRDTYFGRLLAGDFYTSTPTMKTGHPRTDETRRTCTRCGHVWYVTAKERRMKAPNGMQIAGAKMQSAGNRRKVVGGKKKAIHAEQRLGRMLDHVDRVERINRCSECGSGAFSEASADT